MQRFAEQLFILPYAELTELVGKCRIEYAYALLVLRCSVCRFSIPVISIPVYIVVVCIVVSFFSRSRSFTVNIDAAPAHAKKIGDHILRGKACTCKSAAHVIAQGELQGDILPKCGGAGKAQRGLYGDAAVVCELDAYGARAAGALL